MKIKWRGKLRETNALPTTEIPPGLHIFKIKPSSLTTFRITALSFMP